MIELAVRFAKYAATLRFEALPAATVHEVKRRVLDSLGVAFGAWFAEPCAIARKVAAHVTARPGGTVWGTTHCASIDWAAFANGCLVRYLDYNDTYLSREPAHPSDNIPAAIAVAEGVGATGRQLIAAIVLAYEVQCRLCDATSLRAIGWDHVTYGCFSAALAASYLMELDAGRTRHALGIAGVTSAALRQSRVGELSHWKGCAFANASRHGVFAAMLARDGMTGPAPIFEGSKGFEELVSGPIPIGGPFAEDASAGQGDFMIDQTSVKCWPVEYHAQSAVEAALKLRGQLESPAAIAAVIVESHDAAVDIIGSEPEKWAPTSRETADHSLPYIVAAALRDGEVTPRQFDEQHLRDAELLRLVSKVKVVRNAELSAIYPHAVGNIVTIQRGDGSTLSSRVDYPCGHARNRMSDALVEEKFHRMADGVIGAERANRLSQWVRELERQESIPPLLNMLVVEQ
ncbi:MAG TPA: MmgE/PrpD family protein [Tepidisphaeraceae bacterium]|jgi:2-methylcitrate dehydratase